MEEIGCAVLELGYFIDFSGKGLDTFQKYFADYEEQYVLIGGAACDILFESNEVNFRLQEIWTWF